MIDSSYGAAVPLAGGTTDAPVAIGRGAGPEFVVKADHPGVIWAAAKFLSAYGGSQLVTPLRHVDARHRYLAYRYAPGVPTRDSPVPIDKAEALSSLAGDLLCAYVPAGAAADSRGDGPIAGPSGQGAARVVRPSEGGAVRRVA